MPRLVGIEPLRFAAFDAFKPCAYFLSMSNPAFIDTYVNTGYVVIRVQENNGCLGSSISLEIISRHLIILTHNRLP